MTVGTRRRNNMAFTSTGDSMEEAGFTYSDFYTPEEHDDEEDE